MKLRSIVLLSAGINIVIVEKKIIQMGCPIPIKRRADASPKMTKK